ncbi:MAG: DUF1287 domain-containing protein [Desulfatitalea sp.]|nr:DUF1287 domain-containing protein [Desulfatitalea sp.]
MWRCLTCLLLLLPAIGAKGHADSDIIRAARAQIGKTRGYDASYRRLPYPNGDVPLASGVCTDVVIRTLRAARGMDLQRLVHEDMRAHFKHYPEHWGLSSPDPNIDHRRVPNLQVFFQRQGWSLPLSRKPERFHPGDLVTCNVPGNRPHIMIISDKRTAKGVPWVIHNIGAGVREENRLFEFRLTGHYRISAQD